MCCYSRLDSKFVEEELIIQENETLLPFALINLEEFEHSVTLYLGKEMITEEDLVRLFEDSNIKTEVLYDSSVIGYNFCREILDSKKNFNKRLLVLGAVLTNLASVQSKLKIIEKCYGFSNNEEIKPEEIQRLVEDIVEISVNWLPLAAISFETQKYSNRTISSERLREYKKELFRYKTEFFEFCKYEITKNECIKFTDLEDLFINTQLGNLFRSFEVRHSLAKFNTNFEEVARFNTFFR